MTARKAAFAPVVDANTRVLVLGSLPGEISLAEQRYYANPRNRFWHLIGGAIDRPDLPALDYGDRLVVLLSRGVGLWDAVASATRKGSLDSAIREVEAAGLVDLASSLLRLRAVGFNGKTSARIGRPLLAGRDLALVDLPSSSPANAAIPFEQKRAEWMALRQFLI